MSKRETVHTYQSTVNMLKQFQLEGETYASAINRLLDMEESEMKNGFEMEYAVEYNDVSRVFKVKFKDDINEALFLNPQSLEWSYSIDAWDVVLDHESKSIVSYIIKFIDGFVHNPKNFALLEMMGSVVEYDNLSIRRI